jgi:hypothetical protein
MKKPALYAALGSLVFVTSVLAQKSAIEGTAASANGQPVGNAQVQIQQENPKGSVVTTRTDAKGHFMAGGLPVASYNVAVLVGGKVLSSSAHVKTQANQAVHVQLGGKLAASTEKKRWVYVHPPTGSHMGGYQQEGAQSQDPRYQNVDQMSADQAQRLSRRVSPGGGN